MSSSAGDMVCFDRGIQSLSVHSVHVLDEGGFGTNGYGNAISRYEPISDVLNLGIDFVPNKLDCGQRHCCVVSTVNTTKCWGGNDYGQVESRCFLCFLCLSVFQHCAQVGQGHTNIIGDDTEMGDDLAVIDWGTGFAVDDIACGQFHTCALSTNGSVRCCGYGMILNIHFNVF